jgi:hypothetical protein
MFQFSLEEMKSLILQSVRAKGGGNGCPLKIHNGLTAVAGPVPFDIKRKAL